MYHDPLTLILNDNRKESVEMKVYRSVQAWLDAQSMVIDHGVPRVTILAEDGTAIGAVRAKSIGVPHGPSHPRYLAR